MNCKILKLALIVIALFVAATFSFHSSGISVQQSDFIFVSWFLKLFLGFFPSQGNALAVLSQVNFTFATKSVYFQFMNSHLLKWRWLVVDTY